MYKIQHKYNIYSKTALFVCLFVFRFSTEPCRDTASDCMELKHLCNYPKDDPGANRIKAECKFTCGTCKRKVTPVQVVERDNQGWELHLAATSALQPVACHSLYFVVTIITAFGRGLSMGLAQIIAAQFGSHALQCHFHD